MDVTGTDIRSFVAAVEAEVELRGPDEQRWLADWLADVEDAVREGEDDAVAMLLDTLVAFAAWLRATGGQSQTPR